MEDESRGKKKLFQCPFHAWTYDHQGALVGECHSLVALPAVERHGLLWVSTDPQGTLDVDTLLGDLGPELASWGLERCVRHGGTRYGHVQMYDRYGRNHRMALCMKTIDGLRTKPQDEWNVLHGSLLVYYLFPNVQLIVGAAGPTLIRVHPEGANPHQSFSQIGFSIYPEMVENESARAFAARSNMSVEELLATRMERFASVIQNEDYIAAASGHRGALSGAQEYLIFGRNEPALHHYHNTYREALGLPPRETV